MVRRGYIEPPNGVLASHFSGLTMTQEAIMFGIATLSWHFFFSGQTSDPLTLGSIWCRLMLTRLHYFSKGRGTTEHRPS